MQNFTGFGLQFQPPPPPFSLMHPSHGPPLATPFFLGQYPGKTRAIGLIDYMGNICLAILLW